MKKFIPWLLAVGFLLQTACIGADDAPQADILERTEIVMHSEEDEQEDYTPERPAAEDDILPSDAEPAATEPADTAQKNPQNEAASSAPPPAQKPPAPQAEKPPVTPQQKPETPPAKPADTTPEKKPEPQQTAKPQTPPKEPAAKPAAKQGEVRAVWFSYFEYASLLTGKNEAAFTQNVRTAFQNVANLGLNTVIVQVRPFADAVYQSEYFPWSYVVTGEEGQAPNFDPLKIMVKEAHNQGLSIEAWINPYRVRNGNYKNQLCKENVVWDYLKSSDAIEYNGGIYFNPASERAQQLIVNGVREIVKKYDVDGIHFDDYFYPTTDAAFDKASYSDYKNNGGKLTLGDWRRENVNQLVKTVYKAIKEEDPNVIFGISPQGNMDNNYNQQFIDVKLWVSQPGYVDYICPQIYFGFENDTCPYEKTVQNWNNLIGGSDIDLYIGLAPFKIGSDDTWAGAGKQEWKTADNILGRMVQTARKENHYQGFVLFRYDSMLHPVQGIKQQMEKELNQLKEILN